MNDLEEGVYRQYKYITDSLVGEIKETNRESCKVDKMLICAIIVLSILLAVTNMAWLYEWNSYDYETYSVESTDDGNANYIGGSKVITNSEGNSTESNKIGN